MLARPPYSLTSRSPTTAGQSSALFGSGGIGKSTLAAALALDCDIRRAYPDGIFWVEIGREPVLVARQYDLGRVLRPGESRNDYADETSGKARLTALLADKAALVVLDNVWEKTHADTFLVHAPRSRFLVTTRSARLASLLTDADHTLRLDVLSPEEAAALIANWLGWAEDGPHPDAKVHEQIANVVGRQALAVKLVAARLAEQRADFAPTLLERLRANLGSANPFKDLQLDEEDKDLNLEVSLAESYTALSAEMQRRFRLLGVFALEGSFDAAAAAAIWAETNLDDAASALHELAARWSLLTEREDGRYTQHNLLHAYARALAMREGELNGALLRHFVHYINLYINSDHNNRSEPDGTSPGHIAIDADFENVLAVLSIGFANDPLVKPACDLLVALEGYMGIRQPNDLQGRLLNAGLETSQRAGYVLGQANTLKALGDLARRQADLAGARESYDQALPLFEQIGDRLGQANTLQALGDLARAENQPDAARAFYARAREMGQQIGDMTVQLNSLIGLARLARQQGQIDQACRWFEQLFALTDAIPAFRDHPFTQQLRQEYAALCGGAPG